jgi:excisionase family DNA binding protein
MTERLLTTAEVARLIGRPIRTVNRMAERGDILAVQQLPGETGARLYRQADIDAYLSGSRPQGAA